MTPDLSCPAPADIPASGDSPAMRRVMVPAILGILAVLSAAIYTGRGIRYPITGGGETVAITGNLLKDGSFANPFAAGDTGPSAFLPPFYPYFRAGLVLVFGSYGLAAALVITLLVHGLHAALLPSASRLFFGRAAPGIWAASIAIAFPLFDVLHWEAMYVAAGLVLFYLYAANVYARPSGRRGALLGLAAGLLLLANPASLLAFAPWLLLLVWRDRHNRLVWRTTAWVLFAACLTCTPWTIRNYRQFGHFVFIRDNLGLVLYDGNNDCAGPSVLGNLRKGCNKQFAPMYSVAEVDLMRRLGEIEYNRNRARVALNWIARNPRRFAALTARRIVEFWFPLEAYSFWVVTALAIPGILLIYRRGVAAGWAMLVACALFTMLYSITEVTPRYRYPIMWMTLIQAGFALDRLYATVRRRA